MGRRRFSERTQAAGRGVLTVLNNGVLAYQKDAEDVKFGRHTGGCMFSPVDHAAIARACGCRGVNIRNAADYLPALREALACNVTTVLDVDTELALRKITDVTDRRLDAVSGAKVFADCLRLRR